MLVITRGYFIHIARISQDFAGFPRISNGSNLWLHLWPWLLSTAASVDSIPPGTTAGCPGIQWLRALSKGDKKDRWYGLMYGWCSRTSLYQWKKQNICYWCSVPVVFPWKSSNILFPSIYKKGASTFPAGPSCWSTTINRLPLQVVPPRAVFLLNEGLHPGSMKNDELTLSEKKQSHDLNTDLY